MLGRAIDGLVEFTGWVAMAIMGVMALHVFASIAAYVVLGSGLTGMQEIVANYYMVALTFLPLAFVAREPGGHISADLFTAWMGPRGLARLEVAISIMLALFYAVLFWQSLLSALEATEVGETIQVSTGTLDTWIARWALPIGFGIGGLYAGLCACRQTVTALLPPEDDPSAGIA